MIHEDGGACASNSVHLRRGPWNTKLPEVEFFRWWEVERKVQDFIAVCRAEWRRTGEPIYIVCTIERRADKFGWNNAAWQDEKLNPDLGKNWTYESMACGSSGFLADVGFPGKTFILGFSRRSGIQFSEEVQHDWSEIEMSCDERQRAIDFTRHEMSSLEKHIVDCNTTVRASSSRCSYSVSLHKTMVCPLRKADKRPQPW